MRIPDAHRSQGGDRMKCAERGCSNEAIYRFTWPGSPQQNGCAKHAEHAASIARAMGFDLELIEIGRDEERKTVTLDDHIRQALDNLRQVVRVKLDLGGATRGDVDVAIVQMLT